jgi:hypothetical protein
LLTLSTHRQQINFVFFLKGIDIARNIEVIVVVLNLFQAGEIGVFLDVIAITVGLDDFLDVFFAELVLVFTCLNSRLASINSTLSSTFCFLKIRIAAGIPVP